MSLKVVPSSQFCHLVYYGECLYVVLATNVHKKWCAGYNYRNDKESHTFQW